MSSEESEVQEVEEVKEEPPRYEAQYSCLRCGTNVSNVELERLPEIKCICGFRIFTKLRSEGIKRIKAI
ncbi:MAG: RNA polymerase Rbp10 [Candidatus Nitrosoabyssus spongiisocia]|nr:MAG: RNA polymerase Rbp10 [Nitrosopumilaceae archaeon AB1(1)]